jgi:hypothetical protein
MTVLRLFLLSTFLFSYLAHGNPVWQPTAAAASDSFLSSAVGETKAHAAGSTVPDARVVNGIANTFLGLNAITGTHSMITVVEAEDGEVLRLENAQRSFSDERVSLLVHAEPQSVPEGLVKETM